MFSMYSWIYIKDIDKGCFISTVGPSHDALEQWFPILSAQMFFGLPLYEKLASTASGESFWEF